VKIHLDGPCSSFTAAATEVPFEKIFVANDEQQAISNSSLYSNLRYHALKFILEQNGSTANDDAWKKRFNLIGYRKNQERMIYFSAINEINMLANVFKSTFNEMKSNNIAGNNNTPLILHLFCKFIEQDSRKIRASTSITAHRERKRLYKKLKHLVENTKQFVGEKIDELKERKWIQTKIDSILYYSKTANTRHWLANKSEVLVKKDVILTNREPIVHSGETSMGAIIVQAVKASDMLSSLVVKTAELVKNNFFSDEDSNYHDFALTLDNDAEEMEGHCPIDGTGHIDPDFFCPLNARDFNPDDFNTDIQYIYSPDDDLSHQSDDSLVGLSMCDYDNDDNDDWVVLDD